MPLNPTMSTVLVTDDDPDFRAMLERWLSHSGYRVFTAGNATDALALAKRHPMDVVITDLKMPGLSGLDLLMLLKELAPETKVIFLSGQANMLEAIEALREGRAYDFLLKPLVSLDLLNLTIEKALLKKRPSSRTSPSPTTPLSARERQIIALLAEGLENRGIAERLCISENTVKNHLARIYDKLKVSNRVQAALTCDRMGWL
ncbi:Transcriptional regulatory protein DegU [compost metagenome]